MQIAKDIGVEISVVDSGQHCDVMFDMVASSSYADCIKVLAPNGRYITGDPRISRMIRCAITNRFSDRPATFAFAK
ncbi:MAG: hypothetical protein ABGW81_09915 [Paracoccaceae bacterium]